MTRRPIRLLAILFLGAAVVQAAAVTFGNGQSETRGEICSACGPIK